MVRLKKYVDVDGRIKVIPLFLCVKKKAETLEKYGLVNPKGWKRKG